MEKHSVHRPNRAERAMTLQGGWVCPKCQHKNPSSVISCEACGYTRGATKMTESKIPDGVNPCYGVPQEKKYPLYDEHHVRSAIKLFGHVNPKYEQELARAIIAKMKTYHIPYSMVGEDNKLYKYIPAKYLEEEKYENLDESIKEKYEDRKTARMIKKQKIIDMHLDPIMYKKPEHKWIGVTSRTQRWVDKHPLDDNGHIIRDKKPESKENTVDETIKKAQEEKDAKKVESKQLDNKTEAKSESKQESK